MHSKLKKSVKTIKEIFSLDYIEEVSKKTKFFQRKGRKTIREILTFMKIPADGLEIMVI